VLHEHGVIVTPGQEAHLLCKVLEVEGAVLEYDIGLGVGEDIPEDFPHGDFLVLGPISLRAFYAHEGDANRREPIGGQTYARDLPAPRLNITYDWHAVLEARAEVTVRLLNVGEGGADYEPPLGLLVPFTKDAGGSSEINEGFWSDGPISKDRRGVERWDEADGFFIPLKLTTSPFRNTKLTCKSPKSSATETYDKFGVDSFDCRIEISQAFTDFGSWISSGKGGKATAYSFRFGEEELVYVVAWGAIIRYVAQEAIASADPRLA
jgi:hypothetical protein